MPAKNQDSHVHKSFNQSLLCIMKDFKVCRADTGSPAILKGLNHLAQGCPESSRDYHGSKSK
jgi:hypothetical protein